jgi:hypothetical protein
VPDDSVPDDSVLDDSVPEVSVPDDSVLEPWTGTGGVNPRGDVAD